MVNKKLKFFVLALPLLFFVVAGCGQKLPPGMPTLYPVKITLTYQDGKPLAGATVSLSQAGGDSKWPAVGETDANGVVKDFYTSGSYKGAVADKFKVCVRKVERLKEKIDIPPEPTDPAEKYAWRQTYFENVPPAEEFDLVDLDYNDAHSTPLEIEVTSGKNEFSFDVGEPVRIQYQGIMLNR